MTDPVTPSAVPDEAVRLVDGCITIAYNARRLNDRNGGRAALLAYITGVVKERVSRIGPDTPDNSMVICPQCTSQFGAISVDDQRYRSSLERERDRLRDELGRARSCAARIHESRRHRKAVTPMNDKLLPNPTPWWVGAGALAIGLAVVAWHPWRHAPTGSHALVRDEVVVGINHPDHASHRVCGYDKGTPVVLVVPDTMDCPKALDLVRRTSPDDPVSAWADTTHAITD